MAFHLSRPRQVRHAVAPLPRLEILEDRCLPSTAGFLDPAFGAPNGYVVTSVNPATSKHSIGNDVVVQPDGKIIVVGTAPSSKGAGSLAVLRYNADGTPDSTFGTGGRVLTTLGNANSGLPGGTLGSVALQGDGKIVVAGWQYLSHTGLVYDVEWVLARYNPNGTLDRTFGSGRRPTGLVEINLGPDRDQAHALRIQPWDGKIVVAGIITRTGTGNDIAVGRFNPKLGPCF